MDQFGSSILSNYPRTFPALHLTNATFTLAAMALAHCALSSTISPPSPSSQNPTRKHQSSLPSLPKPPKRKNHLRLKLLKTLTKPYPTPLRPPQQTPENLKESPDHLQEIEGLPILTEGVCDEEKDLNLQNLQQAPIVPEAEKVVSTRSVSELAFYIVGLFIVQTIITVLVMRSGDIEENTKIDQEAEQLELNGKKNIKPDGNVNVDDALYIGKIAEIRAMAKEVRERERKNSGDSSGVIEYEEDTSVPKPVVNKVKGNIEKEVDVKLSKLERRFRSLKEKPFISKVNNLNNPNEINGKKNGGSQVAKVKNENLVFKKKMKFKSTPSNLNRSPKGFQSDKSRNVINGNGVSKNTADRSEDHGDNVLNDSSLRITPEKEEKIHVPVRNALKETMSESNSEEEDSDLSSKKRGSNDVVGRKTHKEKKSSEIAEALTIDNTKSKSGIVRDSSAKLVEAGDSELKTNTSPSLTKHIEHKQVVNDTGNKQTRSENDMWWLNLRYALAILLRRSSETDGPGGLYSLKMEDGSPSYLVAFEDRVDASNFCCILDAFFAELGDLIADVVPLSIQELKAEMETNALNIIVLKKGQLQLYVGQPLADVEMTLRSLVES